jgi:uracil-DNA glycosylase
MLNKWIAAMGLKREQVFIANIVKCRPPGNRVPAPDEVATCTPYLQRQLEIIRPKVIVTLGLPSAKYMLQTNQTMGRLRGQWHEWRGMKLMPTFHPAYVLRSYNEQTRGAVWSDLKQVMAELNLKPPSAAGRGQRGG